MKRITASLLAVALIAVFSLTGCDWEFGGSAENYNTSRHGWVNFSGMYRAASGLLVSDYSTTSGGENGSVVQSVTNETLGSTDGSSTVYSGQLNNAPVVAGSVSITLPGYSFVDQGDGTLVGTNAKTGTIAYGTGAWSVVLTPASPDAGTISGSYQYTVEPGATGGSGATGIQIHTFNIVQDGEFLRFTDNNGSNYEGNLGRMTGTGGSENPAAGDQVIAHYVVRGRSAAGRNVTMVGTFQGVVGAGGSLSDRRLYGTWMEERGRTGDINGQAQ